MGPLAISVLRQPGMPEDYTLQRTLDESWEERLIREIGIWYNVRL